VKKLLHRISRIGQSTENQSRREVINLVPDKLVDGDLILVLSQDSFNNRSYSEYITYRFKMLNEVDQKEVGRIDLRIGNSENLIRYLGHIGYHVQPEHRGNHYAARATRLLLDLARNNGMDELWITCNPDNTASRKTCELAGATFIEVVDVPRNSDFYRAGEYRKCRYRIDL